MNENLIINLTIKPKTNSHSEITITDAINYLINISITTDKIKNKQPQYNHQTELAIQEAREIMNGKVQPKIYHSVDELFNEVIGE